MLVGLLVGPTAVFAQIAQSGITGTVSDNTGGVLPGVTVEVSSPVMIEGVRVANTDGQGVYTVTNLRPGAYSVRFSLPGFSVLLRDGIDLPGSFTATVDGVLDVGAIEETVTVSGQSPIVDVRNVATQRVLQSDVIEALPMARAAAAYVQVLPGVTGYLGRLSVSATSSLSIYGSTGGETKVTVGGHSIRYASTLQSTYYPNQSTTQEIVVQTDGHSAEQQTGGISVNIIPREGSNTFSGFVFGQYTGASLAGDNLTQELKDRGLTLINKVTSNWDFNPAIGGPIVADRLWFYAAFRQNPIRQNIANIFFNKDPMGWEYVLDESRPGELYIEDFSNEVRLTTQLSEKHKLNVSWNYSPHFTHQRDLSFRFIAAPEATTFTPYYPNYFLTADWQGALSNRVLAEFGVTIHNSNLDNRYPRTDEGLSAEVVAGINSGETIAAYERSTGFAFRAPGGARNGSGTATTIAVGQSWSHVYQQKGSLSYVTGSHNFKTGFTLAQTNLESGRRPNQDMSFVLLNTVPDRIRQETTPWARTLRVNADLGLYAQDQWTVDRATINFGVRYDYINASADAISLPERRFVGAQNFAEVKDVPKWSDISPRLGIAYDVFGDSRTALKANLSRYVSFQALGYAGRLNGVSASISSATRDWDDMNEDYVPDCDLTDNQANGECGTISNLNFGKTNPNATQIDPDLLEGFGLRPYNWTAAVSLQHELRPGLSVVAAYHRRWFGNFDQTDNLDVIPANYDEFCVTVPNDSRLPGGGGEQICGLYDLNPDFLGQRTLFRSALNPSEGDQGRSYDGIDLTTDYRFAEGQVAGGINFGRLVTDNCFVVDSPQQHFCKTSPPFQPNIKFSGSYMLPGEVQIAGVIQNMPGPQITARRTFTRADIQNLDRPLSRGAVSVEIIDPGTEFEGRTTKIDLSFSRAVTIGQIRLSGRLAFFNLLNSDDVLQLNTTFGSQWLLPTRVLFPRSAQFEGRIEF